MDDQEQTTHIGVDSRLPASSDAPDAPPLDFGGFAMWWGGVVAVFIMYRHLGRARNINAAIASARGKADG